MICENMLKTIEMARNEFTTKHENQVSYNKDFIVRDLTDLFDDD